MEAKVTSYIFFRREDRYEYVKDGQIYQFSREMIECLSRQYRLQGFMVFADNENWFIVSRVDNEVELFMERLRK